MAPTPSHAVPTRISAGDTLAFLVSAPDTPASAWTGAAKLLGPASCDGSVSASGDDFLVAFDAETTAKLVRGDYRVVVTAELSGARYTIADTPIRIKPNPATVAKDEGLAHCQKMLALIRSALEGRITTDHESYSIGGRSISKISFTELRNAEHEYQRRVAAYQRRSNVRPSIAAAFTVPR